MFVMRVATIVVTVSSLFPSIKRHDFTTLRNVFLYTHTSRLLLFKESFLYKILFRLSSIFLEKLFSV